MPDCMMPFPEDWHDFLKDYSFDDSQEVYTNGSRLIPAFRVEQLIEHLLKAQEAVEPTEPDEDNIRYCGACDSPVGYEVLEAPGIEYVQYSYCPNCGKAVKWE